MLVPRALLSAVGAALVLGLHAQAQAQSQEQEQQSCSVSGNNLSADQNVFVSACDNTHYCGTDGKCHPNGCRKDEYPFGYNNKTEWPPMCPQGTFCPDEMDSCKPLIPLGGGCQLNRDDECKPPPDSLISQGVKSICLEFKCQYQNRTGGEKCTNENTVYTVYETPYLTYGDIISRDNCHPRYYCDAPSLTCMLKKNIGQHCAADKECRSYHCVDHSGAKGSQLYDNNPTGTCKEPPNIPSRTGAWVYVLVALGLVIGGIGLCLTLLYFHTKSRRTRNREIKSYYQLQTQLRDDIQEMYEAAKETVAQHTTGPNSRVQSSHFVRSPGASQANLTARSSQIGLQASSPTGPSTRRF